MKKPITAKELAYVGVFTAIMAVFSQISIPLPFTPVPITLSLFAVYLTSTMLPMRSALLTQVAYILLGAVGVPVFANFRSGLTALAGPTGGYIFSYVLMAAAIAGLSPRIDASSKLPFGGVGRSAAYGGAYLIATAICYTFGTLWLMAFRQASFAQTFALAVAPFLPLDALKIAACAAIAPKLRKASLARAAGA